jgi:hypothetical protein
MTGDWWSRERAGIDDGLGHYQHHILRRQEEDTDRRFDEIGRTIRARTPHYFTADDLMVVMEFKNSPGRRHRAYAAVQTQRDEVQNITKDALAMALTDEVGALKRLTELKWVGVPTASAILAAAIPERFGVIDRFVMGEIGRLVTHRLRVGSATDSPALVTLADALTLWAEGKVAVAWARYSKGLQQRTDELESRSSPREIEKAIWGWAEHNRSMGG